MMMDSMESSKLFMVALIVCNVVLLVLVLVFSGGNRGVSDKDLAEIHNRLQLIENRIDAASLDRTRLERLASKTGEFEELMSSMPEREAGLVSRIDSLEKTLVDMKDKTTAKEPRKEPDTDVKKEPVAKKSVTPGAGDVVSGTSPPLEGVDMGPAAYYTVRKGDTLYSISRRHDLTPEDLIKLNRLDSDRIMPGQRLRIQ